MQHLAPQHATAAPLSKALPEDAPRPRAAGTVPPPTAGEPRACVLRARSGPLAGQLFSGKGRVLLGSGSSADLVLKDAALAHCEITVGPERARVRDLSGEGVFVSGVRVVDAFVDDGALLSVGATTFSLWLGDAAEEDASGPECFGRIVGGSPAMRRVTAELERASRCDATVLLTGETGTGKDLAAEAVHRASDRAERPFIVVDCGAIPAQLMESELFGHEAGSFTGASSARAGAIEAAAGGTLFLDEIGELDLDLQPKLLRALDRREVQRVGSSERIEVDFRIVAATNRDLRAEVEAGRFRADLYYRLAVLEVELPPLRRRSSDLPRLVESLVVAQGGTGDQIAALTAPEAIAPLLRHAWPGNVRELRNWVEMSMALGGPAPLRLEERPSDLPEVDLSRPLREVRTRFARYAERQYLQELLARHGDNVSAAARAAKLDRVYVHRLLSRTGLR